MFAMVLELEKHLDLNFKNYMKLKTDRNNLEL